MTAYSTPLKRFIERVPDPGYRGTIFTWDIDNTYIRTPTATIRDLMAAAATRPLDRPPVPGAGALLREVRRPRRGRGRRPLYFVSSGPVQVRGHLAERMRRDRVTHDGMTLKDQWAHLSHGRISGLKEQVGFKVAALLLARAGFPAACREVLFGDDADADPLAYGIYAAALSGRLRGDDLASALKQAGVSREDRGYVAGLADGVPPVDGVARVIIVKTGFVSLGHPRPGAETALPEWARPDGAAPVEVRDHFQSALVMWRDGEIGVASVLRVAREAAAGAAFDLAPDVGIAAGLLDLHRRGLLDDAAAARAEAALRRARLLPAAFRFEPGQRVV